MIGGRTIPKPATPEIQLICEKIKKQNNLEGYHMFKAIEYQSQIVTGTNYNIKVQVNEDGSCVFIRIFQTLPQIDHSKLAEMHLSEQEEIYYLKSTQLLQLIELKEGYKLSSQLK